MLIRTGHTYPVIDTLRRSPLNRTDPSAPFRRQSPRRPSPKSAPEPRTLTLPNGTTVSYIYKTSARARRIRLVIRPATGLEVVAPTGTSATRVDQVLAEKASWISRTLERMSAHAPAALAPLADGQALSCAGQTYTLSLRIDPSADRPRLTVRGLNLRLVLPRPDDEAARALLERWYRKQARAVFAERVRLWNERYGFAYGRITVKDQRTRWGSCSRQGNLNFNWRLLLAPLPVLDYVVVHELAHLREQNHSPRFWALVATVCPDYKLRRRWLRDHGNTLHL